MRKNYLLVTDKGNKILKKMEYQKSEFDFINDALKYVKKGFSNIMDNCLTKYGQYYVVFNSNIYFICNFAEGHQCEFSNNSDRIAAAEGLAQLHKSSEGYKDKPRERTYTGKAFIIFNRKCDELMLFKKIAAYHHNKSSFDVIFLENIDFYLDKAKKASELLSKSNYFKVCSDEGKVALCHHDLASHNIIIKDNHAAFMNFDNAIIDLKVHDLCNLINNSNENKPMDFNCMEEIINSYCMYNEIDLSELEILNAYMNFPEQFYSVSRDYYGKIEDWEEEVFVNKLTNRTSHKEEQEETLNSLKNYIDKY